MTVWPSNKGMKLTKPGQLRSFAAYPRCSPDKRRHVAYFGSVDERGSTDSGDARGRVGLRSSDGPSERRCPHPGPGRPRTQAVARLDRPPSLIWAKPA